MLGDFGELYAKTLYMKKTMKYEPILNIIIPYPEASSLESASGKYIVLRTVHRAKIWQNLAVIFWDNFLKL